MYTGWEIYTHRGRISSSEWSRVKNELKKRFSDKGWFFEDNDHKVKIIHEQTEFEVEVVFHEAEFSVEEDLKEVGKYGIVLKSIFLGYKDERSHRRFFGEVHRRIPWKKQGFWLEDGKRILIPKTIRLRMK